MEWIGPFFEQSSWELHVYVFLLLQKSDGQWRERRSFPAVRIKCGLQELESRSAAAISGRPRRLEQTLRRVRLGGQRFWRNKAWAQASEVEHSCRWRWGAGLGIEVHHRWRQAFVDKCSPLIVQRPFRRAQSGAERGPKIERRQHQTSAWTHLRDHRKEW